MFVFGGDGDIVFVVFVLSVAAKLLFLILLLVPAAAEQMVFVALSLHILWLKIIKVSETARLFVLLKNVTACVCFSPPPVGWFKSSVCGWFSGTGQHLGFSGQRDCIVPPGGHVDATTSGWHLSAI